MIDSFRSVRRSTYALVAAFLAVLVLYVLVRPTPDAVAARQPAPVVPAPTSSPTPSAPPQPTRSVPAPTQTASPTAPPTTQPPAVTPSPSSSPTPTVPLPTLTP
jgi:hypothetical protein